MARDWKGFRNHRLVY